jgi:hypothetical protein
MHTLVGFIEKLSNRLPQSVSFFINSINFELERARGNPGACKGLRKTHKRSSNIVEQSIKQLEEKPHADRLTACTCAAADGTRRINFSFHGCGIFTHIMLISRMIDLLKEKSSWVIVRIKKVKLVISYLNF